MASEKLKIIRQKCGESSGKSHNLVTKSNEYVFRSVCQRINYADNGNWEQFCGRVVRAPIKRVDQPDDIKTPVNENKNRDVSSP